MVYADFRNLVCCFLRQRTGRNIVELFPDTGRVYSLKFLFPEKYKGPGYIRDTCHDHTPENKGEHQPASY
jgi:hypothetical protein